LSAFSRSIDTILWGRKTYDFAVKMRGVGGYGNVKHYVFSRRTPPSDAVEEVEFVSESILAFVGKLRAQKGKNIWMMGGASIIGLFLETGAIDEFSIA
jgi:dihydrofolate reductase